MTIGEDRMRTRFNPSASASSAVDQIKQKTAELIDICEEAKILRHDPATNEVNRLWALAQDAYEVAAMHAVKAATALG